MSDHIEDDQTAVTPGQINRERLDALFAPAPARRVGSAASLSQAETFVVPGYADEFEPKLFRGVFFGLVLASLAWAAIAVAVLC